MTTTPRAIDFFSKTTRQISQIPSIFMISNACATTAENAVAPEATSQVASPHATAVSKETVAILLIIGLAI